MGGDETKNDKIATRQHEGVTWVDVRIPDSTTFAELEERYHLHPIHLTESVQKVQHTQVEREEDYLFLALHFPVFEPHTDKIFAGQIGVFLGKDFLITVHAEASASLQNLWNDSERAPEHYYAQGSAYLLYALISNLLGSIAGMTELVEGELDEIESLVFENSTSDAMRIGKLRQKIVRLKRLIGPKRTLLQDLSEEVRDFSHKDISKYYGNNVKMVDRLWEVIEEAQETIEIYKDADFTTSTEKTNSILAILTLVFTFTIPVTVVAGLYGMNVLLPGGDLAGSWMFMGRYTTFILVLVVSTLVAGGMYVYFRRNRWLR